MDWRRTARQLMLLPNIITLSRLVWTALFVAFLDSPLRLWFFALAFVTDPLDGRVARWRDQETWIGARLDQAVDRITILVLAVATVTWVDIHVAYLVLLLLYPAFAAAGLLAAALHSRGGTTGTDWLEPGPRAKWALNIQFAALAALLLRFTAAGKLLIIVGVALSAATFAGYMIDYLDAAGSSWATLPSVRAALHLAALALFFGIGLLAFTL